jgi:hypothetical protein
MPATSFSLQAGNITACQYSGAVVPAVAGPGAVGAVAVGSDVFLFSGPGRLQYIIPHATYLSLSGVAVNLYDGAAALSGGPIAAQSHIPLGGLAAGAGVSGQLIMAGVPIPMGVPFNSGLIINSRSGQTGVTIVWSSGPSI